MGGRVGLGVGGRVGLGVGGRVGLGVGGVPVVEEEEEDEEDWLVVELVGFLVHAGRVGWGAETNTVPIKTR